MNPFQNRRLGGTSLELPLLGFGGAPLGELFEKVPEERSLKILNEAYNSGIRFYDTAP